MQNRILELCAEDDYGVWELAWAVGIRSPEDNSLPQFCREIAVLVRSGIIVAKRRNASNALLEKVELDTAKLAFELSKMNQPNPDSHYWFSSK